MKNETQLDANKNQVKNKGSDNDTQLDAKELENIDEYFKCLDNIKLPDLSGIKKQY